MDITYTDSSPLDSAVRHRSSGRSCAQHCRVGRCVRRYNVRSCLDVSSVKNPQSEDDFIFPKSEQQQQQQSSSSRPQKRCQCRKES